MINSENLEELGVTIDLTSLLIEMQKLKQEQQQLISFLEDKIKETDKLRKMHKLYSVSEERLTVKYYALIEVLYFVNKGGKDE